MNQTGAAWLPSCLRLPGLQGGEGAAQQAGPCLAGPHPLPTIPPGRPARSVHPSARGALALAELLLAPLQRALGEQAEGLRLGRRADPRLDALPPPMIPHSPEHTTSFCAMLASH